jgi:hypothetical protein
MELQDERRAEVLRAKGEWIVVVPSQALTLIILLCRPMNPPPELHFCCSGNGFTSTGRRYVAILAGAEYFDNVLQNLEQGKDPFKVQPPVARPVRGEASEIQQEKPKRKNTKADAVSTELETVGLVLQARPAHSLLSSIP